MIGNIRFLAWISESLGEQAERHFGDIFELSTLGENDRSRR